MLLPGSVKILAGLHIQRIPVRRTLSVFGLLELYLSREITGEPLLSHINYTASLLQRISGVSLPLASCIKWAKLAYQVMLTIRGRLITPFVLGSMSVGLNILIRHSFMDL